MDSPSKTVRKQKKPSFFKIMIKDFSADGMEIPPAFTKKFGKQIPNTIRLEVKGYHEKSWEVEVEKNGKIQCFSKGWREFVEENNLEEFDFLVFKYLVDSKSFKVTIYGRTCCVKEFPLSRERNSELVNGDDNSNTDQRMKGTRTDMNKFDGDKAYEREVIRIDPENEDKGTLKQTVYNGRTKEHGIKDGGKRKRVQEDDDDDDDDSNTDKTNKSDVSPIDSDDEDKGTLKQTVWKARTKKNCIEDNKLLQIKFNSKNPSFEVELTPTHISGGFVHIPMWFTMKHLSIKTEKVAKFHRCKKIWPMRIYMMGYSDKKGTRKARISRGWPDFVKDNELELKDVCVFEMIESNVVFHVHVYRKDSDKKEFVEIF